jgi:hypothetical protein
VALAVDGDWIEPWSRDPVWRGTGVPYNGGVVLLNTKIAQVQGQIFPVAAPFLARQIFWILLGKRGQDTAAGAACMSRPLPDRIPLARAQRHLETVPNQPERPSPTCQERAPQKSTNTSGKAVGGSSRPPQPMDPGLPRSRAHGTQGQRHFEPLRRPSSHQNSRQWRHLNCVDVL